MATLNTIKFNINDFSGELLTDYHSDEMITFMSELGAVVDSDDVTMLQDGRNRNVRFQGVIGGVKCDFVIKKFGLKSSFPNLKSGITKAQKSWNNACHLMQHGVGTPKPVALVEKNINGDLQESYFVTVFESETLMLTEELGYLFREDPLCEKFMNLLQVTAECIKKMHDSGMQHRDLGNQNILMRKADDSNWKDVMLIDLNRAKIFNELSLKQRAKDLSRIFLPSDFLRVFFEMYFGEEIPKEFINAERKYRSKYQLHHKSRKFRHPIREYRMSKNPEHNGEYPADRDLWVWDDRSVQAQNVWKSKEKHKLYYPMRTFKIVSSTIKWFPSVYNKFKELTGSSYEPISQIEDTIGMSISPTFETWEQEYALLKEFECKMPLLIRVYAHEDDVKQKFLRETICNIGRDGYPIMLAFCQNRAAVKNPKNWKKLIDETLEVTCEYVQRIEVGHTINRAKWGIWDYSEYAKMLETLIPVKDKYSQIQWCGPAAIDFDFPDLISALDQVPENWRFDALSHQLYVDRRGAPENTQIGQSTLDKIIWGKAISSSHPSTSGKFIISEVNWPIENTGVYSPVGSPYLRPNQIVGSPSVSEETYAIYMIRYYLIACCSGFVETVYWWQLVAHGFGLVDDRDDSGWRKRKAFFAFKHFLKSMQGVKFEKMIVPNDREDLGGVFMFTGDGYKLSIGYSTLTKGASMDVESSSTIVDVCGEPLDNNEGFVKLTDSPVYITSQL